MQVLTTAPAPSPHRCAIVQANGIGQLVLLLGETELPEARESAAAVISELTRSNKGNLPLIADAGAIPPLVVTMCEGTAGAQKHATCALWGLTQEKTEGARYRTELAKTEGAVARLVELLKGHEGETQGFAAATLVGIAQDADGQEAIRSVGGGGPLMSLALGGHGWLRGQAVEVLRVPLMTRLACKCSPQRRFPAGTPAAGLP